MMTSAQLTLRALMYEGKQEIRDALIEIDKTVKSINEKK